MSARAFPPSPTLTLHGRWLLLVRAAWVAVAVATLGIFAISIPARYAQLTHPTAAVRTALAEMGLSASGHALYNVTLDTVFGLVFAVVAIVIFWRRSDEPMALLVATMMVVWEPLNGLLVQTPSAIEGMYPALEAPLGRLLPYVSYMTWMLFFSLFPSRALRAALDTLALCWVLFSGSWIFTPFGPPSWPPLLFNGAVLALWGSGEASQWPSLTATHASTIEPCTSQTIGISRAEASPNSLGPRPPKRLGPWHSSRRPWPKALRRVKAKTILGPTTACKGSVYERRLTRILGSPCPSLPRPAD